MIHKPPRRHLSLLPSTTLGRWSVVLAVASLVFLLGFDAMVAAGQSGDGWFDNWLLTGPILGVAVAGVAGLIAGIIAIVRDRERGLLLVIPILWGLVVTSFALGEFTNPH